MAFAHILTHYARSYAWLDDCALLRAATVLSGIPGILVNGRFDFQGPISEELVRATESSG
jgi:proline iminopeptidase